MLSGISVDLTPLARALAEFFGDNLEKDYLLMIDNISRDVLVKVGILWRDRAKQYVPESSGKTADSMKYIVDMGSKEVSVVYNSEAGVYAEHVAGWSKMKRLVKRAGKMTAYGISKGSAQKQSSLGIPGLGVGGDFIIRSFEELEPEIEKIIEEGFTKWW